MKRIVLIVLAVVGFVCMGCNSEASDSPSARLQGKWYVANGDGGLTDDQFIEFKGNTMRHCGKNNNGEIRDISGPFTCTETVITVDLFDDYYGDGKPFNRTYTIPYTIGKRKLLTGEYTTLFIDKSSYFYPGGMYYKKN